MDPLARRIRPSRAGRPAALLAVLALLTVALGACSSSTTAGSGRFAGNASPLPSASGTPPSGEPSGQPSASPVPSGPTTSATYRGLQLGLAAGWTLTPQGNTACIRPGPAGGSGCALVILDVAAATAARQPVVPPDPKAERGWWVGTGPPVCADDVAVTGSTLVDSSFVKLRNKTAAYGKWDVRCSDTGKDFSPRVWWLPVSEVALIQPESEAAVDPTVDLIVTSVTVNR